MGLGFRARSPVQPKLTKKPSEPRVTELRGLKQVSGFLPLGQVAQALVFSPTSESLEFGLLGALCGLYQRIEVLERLLGLWFRVQDVGFFGLYKVLQQTIEARVVSALRLLGFGVRSLSSRFRLG